MFVVPGMVGANEGAVEGLETKIGMQQEGDQILNESIGKLVSEEAMALYNNDKLNPNIERRTEQGKVMQRKYTLQQAYEIAWNNHKDEYMQAKRQIDWASSIAGVQNFWVNSLINGMLNQTLKAGLMAPRVQETLRNSRLFGWVYRNPRFTIDEATNTATENVSKFGTLKQMIKEPFGELLEEYSQSVSNDTFSGGAKSNIISFIDNKLNGDGTAKIGDTFSEDLSAAFTALKGSLTDKESIQSAILGAVGSVMGTLSTPGRAYHRDRDGNLVRNKWYLSGENL